MDFAACYPQRREIINLFQRHGFREDAASATVPGLRRTILDSNADGVRGDIFYDVLSFCHSLDLRGRLELHDRTIALADLMLQKMQILGLTEKDAIDVQMLLLDHDLGPDDHVGISKARIAQVCGSDWGFFRTFSLNIERIEAITASSPYLNVAQRERIASQLARLRQCVGEMPKSLGWRLRSLIGDRLRWYETVDEH